MMKAGKLCYHVAEFQGKWAKGLNVSQAPFFEQSSFANKKWRKKPEEQIGGCFPQDKGSSHQYKIYSLTMMLTENWERSRLISSL